MTTINEAIENKIALPLNKIDSQLLGDIQTKLKELNYYFSNVDSLYGPQIQGAWSQFKSDYNQSSPTLVGAGSLSLLNTAKPRILSYNAAYYSRLFYTSTIRSNDDCDDVINNYFIPHKSIYINLENDLGIPWYIVACLHYREASCDFSCHLYNGDPLSARTVNVPSGQPPTGNPPFSWEFSAKYALEYDGLNQVKNWSIESALYQCEKYNGMGYHHLGVNSPYLWSGTNQYRQGKYVADGRYSPTAIDEQLGVVALIKRMQEKAIISIY